jgi:hypothetical protein
MDVSAIIGVVLGLAVAYWVIATACSFIVEWVSSFMNIRGKALSRFVAQMIGTEIRRTFGSPSASTASAWYQRLVEWVRSLFRLGRPELRRDRIHRITADSSSSAAQMAVRLLTHPSVEALDKPLFGKDSVISDASYIPAEQFARALLDVVVRTPTRQTLSAAIEASNLPQGLRATLQLALTVDPQVSAERLLQSLRLSAEEWLSGGPLIANATAEQLKTRRQSSRKHLVELDESGIPTRAASKVFTGAVAPSRLSALATQVMARLVNPDGKVTTHADVLRALQNDLLPATLKAAVMPMVEQAAHDLDESRKAIERWYDSSMERASGWYKRYTTVWLLVTGFVVAGLFGLDSIRIGQGLANNAEHRAAAERLARRINEEPGEVRAWVQRTVVTAGLSKDSVLNSDKIADISLFDGGANETKLLWELQAVAASFGDGRFGAAAVLVVREYFAERKEKETDEEGRNDKAWAEISAQVDRARDCDPAGAADKGQCAPTAFQRAVEESSRDPKDRPDLALKYWSDPVLVNPANIELAQSMHEALRSRDSKAFEKFQEKLKARALPFPWFVSANHVWPLKRLKFEKWKVSGVEEFSRDFFDGFWGKFITALMVAFGAPFWYEIIGKVVNMRGTGAKPSG